MDDEVVQRGQRHGLDSWTAAMQVLHDKSQQLATQQLEIKRLNKEVDSLRAHIQNQQSAQQRASHVTAELNKHRDFIGTLSKERELQKQQTERSFQQTLKLKEALADALRTRDGFADQVTTLELNQYKSDESKKQLRGKLSAREEELKEYMYTLQKERDALASRLTLANTQLEEEHTKCQERTRQVEHVQQQLQDALVREQHERAGRKEAERALKEVKDSTEKMQSEQAQVLEQQRALTDMGTATSERKVGERYEERDEKIERKSTGREKRGREGGWGGGWVGCGREEGNIHKRKVHQCFLTYSFYLTP
jgi:chromosome segregation ATPase